MKTLLMIHKIGIFLSSIMNLFGSSKAFESETTFNRNLSANPVTRRRPGGKKLRYRHYM